MRLSYAELKKKIAGIIPKGIDYEIDLEAGSISVIQNNLKDLLHQLII